MRCEVCGVEIRGKPYRKIIEGGKMTVCSRCASFGSAEWTPIRSGNRGWSRPATKRPKSEVEAAETLELVEDYGIKIKRTRQKARMTVEDFSRKIMEKESVIKKIEKEDLNPDRKLIQKIERALKIKLLEVGGNAVDVLVPRQTSTSRTIGDIWKLAQDKNEKEKKG